ncbi:MAG: hypothetical protein JXJ04_04155 [Spirochaetales bacterium]|nr:hypothetical protein [Spirochaetales bacterium]
MKIKLSNQQRILFLTVLLFAGFIQMIYSEILNNTSDIIKYYGTWTHTTQTGAGQNNTISHSYSTTAKASFNFYGNYIKYYTKKGPGASIVEIWIDGNYMESIDLYSPSKVFQFLAYENDNLSTKIHFFEVRNTNTRNPSSSAYYMHVDWFEFLFNAPTVHPTPTPMIFTPTPTPVATAYVTPSPGSLK